MNMTIKIAFEDLAKKALELIAAGATVDDACTSLGTGSINRVALKAYLITNHSAQLPA